MPRKFLYGVAAMVALVIASLLGLNFWAKELSNFAFVPSARYTALAALPHGAYDGPSRWISRGSGEASDPAHWLPRGAAKAEAPLDLRTIVLEARLEAAVLTFATRLGALHALNPLKVLGALFTLQAAELQGLVRTGVDLKADPRLGQAERFEPKLKNMFEDAVLLGGGSNITLVDEDDDDPILVGG